MQGGLGAAQRDLRQDLAERREALVDVATDEELVGGSALEVEQLGRPGPHRGLLVGARGLGAPAGVGQGRGEPGAERATLVVVGRAQLDHTAVEFCRAVESERVDGFLGGLLEVPRSLHRLARLLEVDGQSLRVGRLRFLEHLRQLPVPGRAIRV